MRLYPERTPSLLHGIHVKFEKRTIKVDIAAVRFSHLPVSCPIKALPSLERRGRSTPLLATTLDATSAQRQDPHAKHAAELTCCTARELPSLCIAWQERASSTAWCKTPRNQGPTKRRKTQGSQDFVYKCLQFTVLSRFT